MNRAIPDRLRELPQLCALIGDVECDGTSVTVDTAPNVVEVGQGAVKFASRLADMASIEKRVNALEAGQSLFCILISECNDELVHLLLWLKAHQMKADLEQAGNRLIALATIMIQTDGIMSRRKQSGLPQGAIDTIQKGFDPKIEQHLDFFNDVALYFQSEISAEAGRGTSKGKLNDSSTYPTEKLLDMIQSIAGVEERRTAFNQALLAMQEVAYKRESQLDNEAVRTILAVSVHDRKAMDERLRRKLGTWRSCEEDTDANNRARNALFRSGIGLQIRKAVRKIDPEIFCQ